MAIDLLVDSQVQKDKNQSELFIILLDAFQNVFNTLGLRQQGRAEGYYNILLRPKHIPKCYFFPIQQYKLIISKFQY